MSNAASVISQWSNHRWSSRWIDQDLGWSLGRTMRTTYNSTSAALAIQGSPAWDEIIILADQFVSDTIQKAQA